MDDEVIPVETEKPPKERVKLTHSTWAKVGAIVLLYVSLLCVIACAACFLFFAYAGLADAYNLRSLLDIIDLDLAGGQFVYDLVLFAARFYSACVPVGIVFIALALACLIFLFCAATRVKCGKWWRNTVIYRILRLIWRVVKAVWHGIGRFGRMIPIVWRTALIMLGLFTIGFILFILMYDQSGGWLLIGLLYAIVIYAAAIFGAWQMKSIKKAGQQLAEGNFNEKIDTTRMYWEFKSHAENLNSIGDGLSKEVAQRMKSERLKTELITNVSHDIKTPLTSIINYVDLLQKSATEEERREYLAVLDRQSHRLKKLTEDLVEASKASTGNMSVNLAPTNTQEIINQSFGEYSAKLEAGRLLWRVIDNLFNNVVKYALPETRVYVDVRVEGSEAVISMKNISRAALNVSADELMERFVRGDASRSTDGSGLGLNIAKSLTELQHGEFSISTDGDLFKAEIRLPLA